VNGDAPAALDLCDFSYQLLSARDKTDNLVVNPVNLFSHIINRHISVLIPRVV
jgi:hypothetical protein